MSMRKTLTRLSMAAFMLFVSLISMTQARAGELLLNENFSYKEGNLYQQGPWLRYGGNTATPIKVVSGGLLYAGYQTEAVGNRITMGDTASGEDLFAAFSNETKIGEGSVYAAFLMRVSSAPESSPAYFFSFFPQTKAGIKDGGSATEYGRLFLQASTNEGKYKLGVTRFTAAKNAVWTENEYEYNKTYLVIVKYTVVEGATNDVIDVWVNPDLTAATEPAADVTYSSTSGSDPSLTYGGIMGLEFRQGATSTTKAPVLDIDAVRVATVWADLFGAEQGGGGEGEEKTPAIAVTKNNLNFYGSMEKGKSMDFTTTISGTNLKGDITIEAPADVTPSKTTITAEEAAEGVKVTFTLTPNPAVSGEYSTKVTLKSQDAEDVVINIGVTYVVVPVALPTALGVMANVAADPDADFTVYKYSGKAVITYVERVVVDQYTKYYNIYAQDMTGGICFSTEYIYANDGTPAMMYKAGDEISGILGYIRSSLGAPYFAVVSLDTDTNDPYNFATITASDKVKEPLEINEAVTEANAESYLYRLVKIDDVKFTVTEGEKFAVKNHNATYGDSYSAVVRPFAGTDLIGTDVPAGKCSVVGISKSAKQFTLSPRSLADITVAPDANITAEKLYKEALVETNKTTELMKYTVVANNLPAAVKIELTGGDEAFSVSHTEIPAGSSVTEVIVSINPATVGTHKGGIYFNFDAIDPQFNAAYTFSTKAFDPLNLPQITLSETAVELEAKVGETDEKELTLTPTNCFDYINVSAGENTASGIIISNTMFMYNTPQTFKVKFTAKEEGTVSQTFTFTTTKGEPVVLTVTAKGVGEVVEEPVEGDEFVLDSTSPLASYSQQFDNVEHNKPLSVEGWTNVAETGKRAWWGYTGTEDEPMSVAKATLYESDMTGKEPSEASMLLISPALDFNNARTPMLEFSLMGKFLHDGQKEKLTICMIEKVADTYEIYELEGFSIPEKADESGTWIPYQVNMSSIPDMPEVFYIGFRMKGTRCKESTATYYIDNFTWGTADVPNCISNVRVAEGGAPVFNMQGVRVLNSYDANSVRNLAPGIYVSGGRKFVVK